MSYVNVKPGNQNVINMLRFAVASFCVVWLWSMLWLFSTYGWLAFGMGLIITMVTWYNGNTCARYNNLWKT